MLLLIDQFPKSINMAAKNIFEIDEKSYKKKQLERNFTCRAKIRAKPKIQPVLGVGMLWWRASGMLGKSLICPARSHLQNDSNVGKKKNGEKCNCWQRGKTNE